METGKKAYFISDLHLGARYIADHRKHELRVVRFLDSIKNDAAQIYLMGDILDFWFEYKYVVPRGFTRFFGKIAELADSGIEIFWITGNHDIWIFDYLPGELGVTMLADGEVHNVMDHRIFLAHGDNHGNVKRSYRILRSVFHNKFCQWLFSCIHPRITLPFALGWSKQSRKGYGGIANRNLNAEKVIADCGLIEFAANHNHAHPEIEHYVFGHIHCPAQKGNVTILGDWFHDEATYAVLNPETGALSLQHYK